MRSAFISRSIKSIFIATLLFVIAAHITNAEGAATAVPCGTILEAELTATQKGQEYLLQVTPGTTISFTVEPIGTTFNPIISLSDATGARISDNSGKQIDGYYGAGNLAKAGESELVRDLVVSSRNPSLYIQGYNDSIGAFDLSLSCTLRDGTVINAGERAPTGPTASNSTPSPANNAATQTCPTLGYCGLASIDFSEASLINLIPDIPITSTIKPDGAGVSGFSFEAKAGNILNISAKRLDGNLGVGFVVFGDPNTPVFIAGPISADTFSTKVTLPKDGKYVIGLFRMGDAPAGATATDFQVTASVSQ